MYRVYHNELTTLQFLFIKNSDTHMHDTCQRGHYHIPLYITTLGKSSLRYVGALLWNKVLNAVINPNVSDSIFSRNLTTAICNNLLKQKFYKNCMLPFTDEIIVLSLLHSCSQCILVEINEVKCIRQGAHKSNRISSSLCSHNMG